MQNVRQFSLFSTPSLQMSDKPFSPFAFCFPPYLYMGRYAPKEGKIKEKVTKYFSISLFCLVQMTKKWLVVFSVSRTRVRARLPTAMLIFCCHKCHTRGKFGGKNRANFGGRKKEKNDFWSSFQPIFSLWNSCLLKYVWKYVVMDWIIVCCLLFCDTCDSKNAKTPVMRVYACAREKGVIDVFTIRMQCSRFQFRG